jgi:hypothetical protein
MTPVLTYFYIFYIYNLSTVNYVLMWEKNNYGPVHVCLSHSRNNEDWCHCCNTCVTIGTKVIVDWTVFSDKVETIAFGTTVALLFLSNKLQSRSAVANKEATYWRNGF